MNVLVLGGGGREHALVRALRASSKVKQVGCAPGNPGIAQEARTYIADPTSPAKVLDLVKRVRPDLVVVGPEAPLAAGVSDYLRRHEFTVFGPSQKAAQLETSKVFSKNFLLKHSISTAPATVCQSAAEMVEAANKLGFPCVVKVDGLAAGKGVRILKDAQDLEAAGRDIFEKKLFGASGNQVLVEAFIEGEEISLMLLVSGKDYQVLPLSRDHKKLKDGDEGPNTGGMGAYAPLKMKPAFLKMLTEKIIEPTIQGLVQDGIEYHGVLYIGIMLSKEGPSVLEFNVRFGDPEAQVLLPLFDGDWAEVFLKIAKKEKIPKLKWKPGHAVSVVIAGPGYPDSAEKGIKIKIDKELKESKSNYLLHAGTAAHKGFITSGGRVLNAVGIDKTLAGARKRAYALVQKVEFSGMQYRLDIAKK